MASTYSDRLRIELMAAGDQSGTWGDTTNTNLGTLIEEAIAGLADVSMTSDTDYTLTANNGATDEARQMILKVASTVSLTATRAVIIPQKEKLYIVHNNTTGSQKIHVKTSAATGVEVSAGFQALVYCDGTNVISVLPQALNETATSGNVLSYNGSNWVASDPDTLVNTFSSGMILNWAGNISSPPSGWLVCDGTAVSRTTYSSLFTAISTAFGTGDGSTTFNIPDMRDKFVIGSGNTYNQGDTGGSADAIVPSHNHTASFSGGSHYHNTFRGEVSTTQLYDQINGVFLRNHAATNRDVGADPDAVIGGTNNTPNGGRTANASLSGSVTVNTTGTSVTDANLPPYVALGYIIKT